MEPTPTVRLATFNVHGFCDASGKKRVDDVIAFLRAIDADVLVLNEVTSPDHSLVRLTSALAMTATYGAAGWGGNAVLVRDTQPIAGASAVVALDDGLGGLRSAVIVPITLAAGEVVDLVGLHLEHTSEATRVLQMERLHAALATRNPAHILAGDFNAMRMSDYPSVTAAHLARGRERYGWEPAREDVVFDLDRRGYVDAVRLASARSVADYRAALGAPIAAEHAITSRVETRIDHIYLSPALVDRVQVVTARTIGTEVSDHYPVVVTIRA